MEIVNVALIASGSGTDANSIMQAYRNECLSGVDIVWLISTKHNAGCLDKADNAGVKNDTITRSDYPSLDAFNEVFAKRMKAENIQIVFLVGCLHKIYPIDGVDIYNIHPCDIHKHGGDGMYDLRTHEHVLSEIKDEIVRGRKTVNDRFFTYPTVHEATLEYDAGAPLMVGAVEIPTKLIEQLLSSEINLYEAAEILQKIVLPYEWKILPCAVQMAAQRIFKMED